jgi:phosphoglycolate phosphatase
MSAGRLRAVDGAGSSAGRAAPAVVFLDLDGCLVDSTRPITGSLVHALEMLGVAAPRREELVRFIGPPLVEAVTTLLTEAGEEPTDARVAAGVDAYRARYVEVALTQTTVVPGVPAALAALVEVTRLVLVTSKPGRFAAPIVTELGLDRWLDAVVAPALDHRAEPKTATLSRALTTVAAGVDPATTVMVGDRSHDVLAGQACGTRTVGVTWGAGSRTELQAAGADRIVDSPAELVAALT